MIFRKQHELKPFVMTSALTKTGFWNRDNYKVKNKKHFSIILNSNNSINNLHKGTETSIVVINDLNKKVKNCNLAP